MATSMIEMTHFFSPLAAPRDAGAPFDNTDADLVLRSADGMDFKVHKLFLTKAFDFFDDMLTIGHGIGHEMRGGMPVFTLPESAQTIDRVLRLIYTTEAPDLSELAELREVCAVLDKYCVRSFPRAVSDALIRAATRHPELIYALACRYSLPVVAEAAARQTLRAPRQLAAIHKSDLEHVSTSQQATLRRFQQEAIACAADAAASLSWLHMNSVPGVGSQDAPASACACPRRKTAVRAGHAVFEDAYTASVPVPAWCLDYCENVANALKHGAYASGKAAMSPNVFEHALSEAAACGFCRDSARTRLFPFALALEAEIDRRIALVPFPRD